VFVSRLLPAVVVLLAVIFGAGCSAAPYYQHPVELSVQVTDAANRDMPVAVEVVYVYDPALTDTLAGLSATQWFRRRPELAWRHPNGFERWRWEWAPGQSVPPKQLPTVFFTRAVFVYAGYQSPGTHRARVPPFRPFKLELNQTNFQARAAP
jgi:type VI secretion system protein